MLFGSSLNKVGIVLERLLEVYVFEVYMYVYMYCQVCSVLVCVLAYTR